MVSMRDTIVCVFLLSWLAGCGDADHSITRADASPAPTDGGGPSIDAPSPSVDGATDRRDSTMPVFDAGPRLDAPAGEACDGGWLHCDGTHAYVGCFGGITQRFECDPDRECREGPAGAVCARLDATCDPTTFRSFCGPDHLMHVCSDGIESTTDCGGGYACVDWGDGTGSFSCVDASLTPCDATTARCDGARAVTCEHGYLFTSPPCSGINPLCATGMGSAACTFEGAASCTPTAPRHCNAADPRRVFGCTPIGLEHRRTCLSTPTGSPCACGIWSPAPFVELSDCVDASGSPMCGMTDVM